MSDNLPIMEELELIFTWNPMVHAFGRRHVANDLVEENLSRQATFYDMHLAPNRICKRVCHVRGLHRNVARAVDEKLQEIRDRGLSLQPPTAPGFMTKAQRDDILFPMGNPLRNQQSVVEFYNTITSLFCIPIASCLALHPTIWTRIMTWSGVPKNNRLASYGGSLQLMQLDKAEARLAPDAITPELMKRLNQVSFVYDDLATWEVTSLSLEDTDAMLGVLVMALSSGEGKFQWKSCPASLRISPNESIPQKLKSTVEYDSPDILSLVEPHGESLMSGSKTIDTPESILDDSLRQGGSSFHALREDISVKEAERISRSVTGSEASSETDSTASNARIMEEMPWEVPRAGHAASQQLIQRAWGQSVRQNTTLLILHAGNYEYVCIRHRETQTLYISDILHVPFLKDPGYGKVQIGIYIAALDDALRRIALDGGNEGSSTVDDCRTPPSKEAAGCTKPTGTHKASMKKRSGGTMGPPSKKRQRTIDDSEWSIQQAISRNFLLLHLYYDIYESPNPEVFHRAPIADSDSEDTPEPPPPPPTPVLTKDARLLLFLNCELGQGSTGVVHGGVLEIETEDTRSRLNVAAKLSFSDEQRERLHGEWSVHMFLTSRGVKGIPTLLGIFYDPEVETAPLCLLTCDAGVSLRKSSKSITSAQRDAFLAVMMEIHSTGVRHGDLRYENLLVDDSGKVTIIDLDRATLNASESSRKEEYRKLCRLLETKVDDSVPEDVKQGGRNRTRIRKEQDSIGVQNPGRVTRSMGTARQTSGGMTLRPRR